MSWQKLLMGCIVYGLLIVEGNLAKTVKKRGVMDNFSDGLKVAGQMFGINTAADVANLVAKAFSNNNNNNNSQRNKPDLISLLQNHLKPAPSRQSSTEQHYKNPEEVETSQQDEDEKSGKPYQTKASLAAPSKEGAAGVNFGTSNLIASMLRLVGFDAAKLGALAINALIMIASAIGSTLMGPTIGQPVKNTFAGKSEEDGNMETGPEEKYSPNAHQPRTADNDITTIEWFLQNSSGKLRRILKEATRTDLADKLTDMITNFETAQGQASCIKMLVCKSSPFIWGMQRSVRQHIERKMHNDTANTEEKGDNFKADTNKSLLNVRSFFTHLPSTEEYREYSEKCEKIYSAQCNTTDVFDKEY